MAILGCLGAPALTHRGAAKKDERKSRRAPPYARQQHTLSHSPATTDAETVIQDYPDA